MDTTPKPIEIPHGNLDQETLNAIVEEFVQREGTDYGLVEVSLETKVRQVLAQLQKGDVKLYFDPATESVTLAVKDASRSRHEFNKE